MSGLLISVRDTEEAQLALSAGVDLLDIKEPRAGSLGAASHQVICDIVRHVESRVPTSAALGELADFDPHLAQPLPDALTYAKLGLSGCRGGKDWPVQWEQAVAVLPEKTRPVAVCYADHQAAGSPAADEIIQQALSLECGAVLVDTFAKQSGSLLDHWTLDHVAEFISSVKSHGMRAVVAGSLSIAAIAHLLPLEPDYIAVRGAACTGGREGKLNGDRLRELTQLVHPRRRVSPRLATGLKETGQW